MVDRAPAKVSVVIPVYNGTNYLREAIDSVLTQTYTNIEIIVVDDGSTDGTRTLMQSYGAQIRGYSKENGGIASALNYGIQRAGGEYIAWLSHDDTFAAHKIERQIQFLCEQAAFQACYTDFNIIDRQGTVIQHYRAPWYPPEQMVRSLFRDMYINGSTILIQRACFDAVGLFDEQLPQSQDLEMWCRLADRFAIGHIAEALVTRRAHPGQLSWKVGEQIAEDQDTYRKIFQRLGPQRLFGEQRSAEWGAPQNPPVADAQSMSKAYIWLGDEMSKYRGWYRFSSHCYQQAAAFAPAWLNPARVKQIWMIVLIIVLGDELHAAAKVRRARLLLGQGEYGSSRALLWQVLRHRPWRLDALALLVLTWTGPAPIQALIWARRSLSKLRTPAS